MCVRSALLLRVSCAFHCFIFPERNELLNWYIQRSQFFFGHHRRFVLLLLLLLLLLCLVFSSLLSFVSSLPFYLVFFFYTMPFVPFFISFGHYLLYATQWHFFFLFAFVFLSLFANRHVLFVCHRFSLYIFESLLHRSLCIALFLAFLPTEKYALQS